MTLNLQPGASFGEYILERRLGGGGFGDVWLSRSAAGAPVALKVLTGQYQSSEVAGLRAEIELLAAAASSRSNHIVRVLGGGSEPAPYVVMEYIEGEDLAREIARRGALPLDEVLRIGEGIADALATLQRAGIIHRDIKPANVITDTHGVVKLTDFGIAKIVGVDSATATGQISLSMAYAAPEVWDGKATQLSDHYAFGALLYQCVTGRAVFSGNYAEIYRHHLQTPPDLDALPAETPLALRDMIGDCLAKEPEQRPQNATLLLAAIEAARHELNGDAAATVFVTRVVEPKRLGPWLIESRTTDRPWTFTCSHQTSGEKAVLELHFSDDLEYAQTLRKAVDVNPGLAVLGAERLLGTSRLVLRPGEAWQNSPAGEFQFWVAREGSGPSTPPRPISTAELQRATDALNAFLAIAKANDLQLDMRAENLTLRPDGAVSIRRPGLPPFPATDPTADVIAFLQSLPLYQPTVFASARSPATLDPPDAISAPPAAPLPRMPEAERIASRPHLTTNPVASPSAPAASNPNQGSKALIFAGVALTLVAIAVAGYFVLGSGSSSKPSVDTAGRSPASGQTPAASSSSASYITQGLASFTAKDYDAANTAFSKAIDLDAKNAEAYYRRGLTYVAQSKPDLALADYNSAIGLDPANTTYLVSRGDLYRAQKMGDLAVTDYTRVIGLSQNNYGAYFGRGTTYGDSTNYDGAVADLSKAIEINGQSVGAYNNRGLAYQNQGKNDLAIQDFTKALSLDPKAVLPYANRGHLYYLLKRYDESLADYNKVIEIEPNAVRYNARGVVLFDSNKPDLAFADYNKAIDLDPKFPLPQYNIAVYYYNLKRYDDALAAVNKAIALDPAYFLAFMERGSIEKVQGKTDLARADFEKAKTLAKTADDTQRAQAALDSLK